MKLLNKKNNSSEPKVLPLEKCLAKTIQLKSGEQPGVSVFEHCLIVGQVAQELIDRMPIWLRENLFPKGSSLIAAAHDVGKVSPIFQEKIHRNIGEVLGFINPELNKDTPHHAVSQATVSCLPKYIPEILGRHHGFTPQNINLPESDIYGGKPWQELRLKLLDQLKNKLNDDWPNVSTSLHSDVLAGLTTVADWVGSGALFDGFDEKSSESKVSIALDNAGFIAPKICGGLTFQDIFEFPPHDVQMQFIESVTTQGCYVLEAPMGIGKTEAALYAAYRMLEKGDATGIYFALPTQLTSDKIFKRMNQFLMKVLEKEDPNRKSLLLHSLAWLRDTELGDDGAPGHSWFSSTKRGLLAPFAVGTIDQALMAVMNVKHGFVRTFGLAGKVVILDEVHSYDSYTGTILNELVMALKELQCTVVILSATLTDKDRRSLLCSPLADKKSNQPFTPYPLISVYPKGGVLQELVTKKMVATEVAIQISVDDERVINEVLMRAERGEQVLWIENTVTDAQNRFRLLAARAEKCIECGLLHSRFLKTDREKNEEYWTKLYGKEGSNCRPEKGRILVGTQVLEQSLDIDSDFLVTRLCPTDMLFQRLGRLWRHRKNDPIRPNSARCEAWILAPTLDDAIQNMENLGKSANVYSPYILCRTLEIWQTISTVKLLVKMRALLESTYIERQEEGAMAIYKQKIEKHREKLRGMAFVGITRSGKTLPESKACTRYSEEENVDALLIKKIVSTQKGTCIQLLNDTELLLPKHIDMPTKRRIAVEILKNTVSVPEYLAPCALTKQIEWLKDYVYLGDGKENPFRVAIVLDSNELQGIGNAEVSEKYNLNYDSDLGYSGQKKGVAK